MSAEARRLAHELLAKASNRSSPPEPARPDLVRPDSELSGRGQPSPSAGHSEQPPGRVAEFTGDQLGLARDPRVVAAATAALAEYGSVQPGRQPGPGDPAAGDVPRRLLEQALAGWLGVDAAVTADSGFQAGAAAIAFVLGTGDVAICDALAPDGFTAGARWSQSRRMSYRHHDPAALDRLLARSRPYFGTALVMLEAVCWATGDIAPLPDLIEVARRHDALVLVDQSGSLGMLGGSGGGAAEHFGLSPAAADLWTGSLVSALAGQGGYLAGSQALVLAARRSAPGLEPGTAGIAPASAAAALAAIEVVRAEPERPARLRVNAERFGELAAELVAVTLPNAGVTGTPGSPILALRLGGSRRTLAVAAHLAARGVLACPVLPPQAAGGAAWLRFALSSEHTPDQLRHAATALREVLS